MSKVHLLVNQTASELVRQGEDGDFSEFFKLDNIRNEESINLMKNLGGESGLARILGVDLKVYKYKILSME